MGNIEYLPICDEIRRHFVGFTYQDITEGDILSLILMLNQEIKKSNACGETSVNTLYVSKKFTSDFTEDGKLICCCIYVSSNYFSDRECIRFDKDGYISLASWADRKNLQPIKRAFLKWCDELKKG